MANSAKSRRRRKGVVMVGIGDDVPGRLVIRDPELRRRMSPTYSPEARRRMDELERSSALAMSRMRRILLD